MSLAKEFKEFAMRGNMVDMAVGIVIGGAFGKIITSLVQDIIMPPIGMLIGGIDFSSWKIILKDATMDAAGKAVPAVSMNIGSFIMTTIDFLIIALCIFGVVKMINSLKRKEPTPEAPAPEMSTTDKLLTEIKELLKK